MNVFISAKKNLIGFRTESGYSFRSKYSQADSLIAPYWASLFAALEFLDSSPQVAKGSHINILVPNKKFIRMKSEIPRGLEGLFATYTQKISFSLNYSPTDIFE